MSSASARHILVDSEEKCNQLKSEIENGGDFAEAAKAHSKCPSGASGGDLGEFRPGCTARQSLLVRKTCGLQLTEGRRRGLE